MGSSSSSDRFGKLNERRLEVPLFEVGSEIVQYLRQRFVPGCHQRCSRPRLEWASTRVGFLEEHAACCFVRHIEEYEAHTENRGSLFRITKIAIKLADMHLQKHIGLEQAARFCDGMEKTALAKMPANRIQQTLGRRHKKFGIRIPLVRRITRTIDKEASLIGRRDIDRTHSQNPLVLGRRSSFHRRNCEIERLLLQRRTGKAAGEQEQWKEH